MCKDPVLYIIMRTDMASLNPGKAMAQASHAANNFQTCMTSIREIIDPSILEAYKVWKNQADGFGTVLVLDGGSEYAVRNIITSNLNNMPAALIIDPSYPLRDGHVTHVIPDVLTCAWVFSTIGKPHGIRNLKLHP